MASPKPILLSSGGGPIRYVYVAAHAFSGSTLTALLLGSHPQIATVGESSVTPTIDIEQYLCSCGSPIRQCAFWRQVAERMAEQGFVFDIGQPRLQFRGSREGGLADRLLRAGPRGRILETVRSLGLRWLPQARTELAELCARNEAFVRAVTSVAGRPVFLDTSKHPNRLLHLLRIPALEVRVIHLIRDPRAVANSCRKNLGIDCALAARSWARLMRATRRVRRFVPRNRWLEVRYESLCLELDETLGRVCRFLDLPRLTPPPRVSGDAQHIIGNRMRLRALSEIRLDERWKQELTAEQVRDVDAIASRWYRRYGYVPGPKG